ncbi:MAG: DNA adenine methylase [Bacteroidota bacterium]
MNNPFTTSLASYPGSKSSQGVPHKIINQIPPHDAYIEGCLGGGTILRKKRPATFNFALDPSAMVVSSWEPASDLQLIQDRFERLFQYDVMDQIRGLRTFVYLDPPYPLHTRNNRRYYEYEMSLIEHEVLLQFCKWLADYRGILFAISTYPNELYERELGHWRKISFVSATRGGPRTELLYMNDTKPQRLHDYSFLGADFRKRDKAKAKLQSRKNKIMAMEPRERAQLLEWCRIQEENIPGPQLISSK